MPQTADYTYDREADCFVVTDAHGNELCRTRSPHQALDKFDVIQICDAINHGVLIFPQTKEVQP